MKIAVLSGKGGTGKTFVSVNLAAAYPHATYIDCDVEEPNGNLFFKPENVAVSSVDTLYPVFDAEKCTGCRKCVDFCRFNALAFVRNKPIVFADICHSCGGCSLVCPSGAVSEQKHEIGRIEHGTSGNVAIYTGILNLGEASAVPVIRAALKVGCATEGSVVIDCPPGSGCPVMESITLADYCVLVAEPTAFGLHNLQMVFELVQLLNKPCGVVVNKTDGVYAPLDAFCKQNGLRVLCNIPYSEILANTNANAQIAYRDDANNRLLFAALLQTIEVEGTP